MRYGIVRVFWVLMWGYLFESSPTYVQTLMSEFLSSSALQELTLQSPSRVRDVVIKYFPHIDILSDSQSYGQTGAEVFRSIKSMVILARFVERDYEALGGENLEPIKDGLDILIDLVDEGLTTLGEGDRAAGFQSMMAVLSIHDLAKSERVAKVAETTHNIQDHDAALVPLVEESFASLRGSISDAHLLSLQQLVEDEAVRTHIVRPRGILGGFNAGHHLNGEAPQRLFLDNVRYVGAPELAEFAADWAGIDGHKDLLGPIALAHVPRAVNRTAHALRELLTSARQQPQTDMVALWRTFSYPADICESLGLSFDNADERAITRIAFMGLEHQQPDKDTAWRNIQSLRQALSALPKDIKERLVAELNAEDLDLGFTPHTIERLRRAVSKDAASSMAFIYELFLRVLAKVIVDVRNLGIGADVLTINFDVKIKGQALDAVVTTLLDQPQLERTAEAFADRIRVELRTGTDSTTAAFYEARN
ncbi:MAG: hypothetical protein AAFN74_11370 [Myxococcota bacterium]